MRLAHSIRCPIRISSTLCVARGFAGDAGRDAYSQSKRHLSLDDIRVHGHQHDDRVRLAAARPCG